MQVLNDIQDIINLHREETYSTDYFADIGIPTLLLETQVFKADRSLLGQYLGRFLAAHPELYQQKTVMDVGCGCGLLGLVCALHGASAVSFSDVSSPAVSNTDKNIQQLHIQVPTQTFVSDCFAQIPPQIFDFIIFNPPSVTGVPKDFLEETIISPDKVLEDFFSQSQHYLAGDGKIVVPYSGKHSRPHQKYAEENGYKVQLIDTSLYEGVELSTLLLQR